MFNRKVVVIALMAVVFLTSFMDGSVSADGRYIRKHRRTKTAEVIMQTVPAMLQANLTSLKSQATGQDDLVAGRVIKHRRKFAYQPGVQPAYEVAADQNTLLESGRIRKEPRKRRII